MVIQPEGPLVVVDGMHGRQGGDNCGSGADWFFLALTEAGAGAIRDDKGLSNRAPGLAGTRCSVSSLLSSCLISNTVSSLLSPLEASTFRKGTDRLAVGPFLSLA